MRKDDILKDLALGHCTSAYDKHKQLKVIMEAWNLYDTVEHVMKQYLFGLKKKRATFLRVAQV